MKISGQVSTLPGVKEVLVGMGTELNKELLQNMGLLNGELEKAAPNDLLIGILAESGEAIDRVLEEIEKSFDKKNKPAKSGGSRKFQTIQQVADLNDAYNMAVVSVPGLYAAHECKIALNNNMHVFLFSDNVTWKRKLN
jgi:succinyl-CoA synthetase alpha subunit